ncbi:MAG: 2-keto-4-pentenoate hydratase [Ramlibacter sp.]|nr:2-keto-4-pentenoate hydratase [Ramlibacter sp.]
MTQSTPPFRLVRFALPGLAPRAGLLLGERIFDLQSAGLPASLDDVFADWTAMLPRLQALARSDAAQPAATLRQVKLHAPVPLTGTLYCAGANYRDHIAEMARIRGMAPNEDDREPWHFIKPTRACITGPGPVVRPEGCRQLDWEAELAVVIGRKAHRVPVADALSFVACYTVANDLSARDLSRRKARPADNPFHFDWLAHKGFDGSCPLGPWLTPADGIDPQKLWIRLAVNGVSKQDSSTSEMIFSVAQQIAHLSRRTTLLPGDISLTGTPAGVGSGRNEFLAPGDCVTVEIEQLGELVNDIVETEGPA